MRSDAAIQQKGVRFVTPDDTPKLCSIYSYYVDNTTVSFEYVSPNATEFDRRVHVFSEKCPYLVFCEGEEILGYAYAHPAFERAAYAWCAETTVYVDRFAKGRGIGSALYGALIEILSLQGYKIVYAVVVADNMESRLFHERNGFRPVATFNKTGYKFRRWLDVVWYERILGEFPDFAKPPLSYNQLPKEELKRIYDKVNAPLKVEKNIAYS